MRLTLATFEGEKTIRALKVGEFFAVHASPLRLFTLSHIPSGRAVQTGMCCQRSAVGLAKALKGFEWNYSLPHDSDAKFPKRLQKSMRQAALVVGTWRCPVHGTCGDVTAARYLPPTSSGLPVVKTLPRGSTSTKKSGK